MSAAAFHGDPEVKLPAALGVPLNVAVVLPAIATTPVGNAPIVAHW